MIEQFIGEYRFLSNFYPCKILYEGIEYPSSEHAYQASKTLDMELRKIISKLAKAGESKKMGQTIPLRPDWSDKLKIQIMYDILKIKFRKETKLAEMLIATGDHFLVEGNTWHDYFWGVGDGVGKNHLGKLLMKIREELSSDNVNKL